jgi:hypothetical protein
MGAEERAFPPPSKRTPLLTPLGQFFLELLMTTIAKRESATAVCRQCGERYTLARHSNRYQRVDGPTVKSARFCSPKCRQGAYRKRVATTPLRAVTSPSEPIDNVVKFGPVLTTESTLMRHIVETEVFAPFRWGDRVSSGGVPIQVARLGKSALVRR